MSPIHNTSLSQLVKVRQYYDSGQNDPIIIHICLTAADPAHSIPHPLITYQHYLKEVQDRVSWQQFTVNRPKQIVNLVLVQKEKNECDKSGAVPLDCDTKEGIR